MTARSPVVTAAPEGVPVPYHLPGVLRLVRISRTLLYVRPPTARSGLTRLGVGLSVSRG
jgi:hypothetical protein